MIPVSAIQGALVEALAPVADQLAEVIPGGERLDSSEWLVVRGNQHVSGCPVADALAGEDPFEPSAAVAGWQAAADAADLVVHGHLDPSRGGGPADPASAFRQLWKDRDQRDTWPWPWLRDDAERADRALTAAEVGRRLAALARMLDGPGGAGSGDGGGSGDAGGWPPAGAGKIGLRPKWTFPGRALRLDGRIDVVLGKRGLGHRLVVVLGGDHRSDTRSRLAFEAVVETVAFRRPPTHVLGLLPDAGRRWVVAVDDGLLAEGVAVVADAARSALGARRRDAGGLERRPGPRCRTCVHRPGCEPGETWLAGPGRLDFGFLPPST